MAAKKARKAKKANTIAVTLNLSEDAYRYLRGLGKSCAVNGNGTVEDVLYHLAQSAADGVRRPGAWERSWLTSAFSDDWTESMRAHPSLFHCQVPADFDAPLPARQDADVCPNPDCEQGVIVVDHCAACEGPIFKDCPTCKGTGKRPPAGGAHG